MPSHANVHNQLRRFEMRSRLDHVQCRSQGFRVWSTAGHLEELPGEPMPETFAADGPGLAMAVYLQICIPSAVWHMKKSGIRRDPNQNIGLSLPATISVAVLFGNRLVERLTDFLGVLDQFPNRGFIR